MKSSQVVPLSQHSWDIDAPITVSIVVTVFNHEKYLVEAIEGLLMQQTNFRVEILINDDASTDRSCEIIESYKKQYPNLLVTIYQKENQYSQGKKPWVNVLFPAAQGQYIAFCEGDDYWTDSLKLQKQVDFLEQNSNYTIVWSKFSKIDTLGNVIESDLPIFQSHLYEVTSQNLLEEYRTWTLTAVFRRIVFNDIDFSKFKYLKDNTVYFIALRNNALGRILDFNSANYRIHDTGVWSSTSEFQNQLTNYYNFNEIINLVSKDESIEMSSNKTFHWLYQKMIDEKFYKNIPFSVYNQLLSNMLHNLTWKAKLRYLRIYFKKLI